MINRILAVALNTFREGMRQRLLLVSGIFAVILTVISIFLEPFALGEIAKIVRDFGLGIASLLAVFVVIFVGASILHRDIERRTIYTVITRPVKPAEIVIGKFAGLSLLVIVLLFAMTAVQQLVLLVTEGRVDLLLVMAPLLGILEILVLVSLLLFFSSFSSATFSSIMTTICFIAGHAAPDLKLFASTTKVPMLKTLALAGYYLIPNLEYFNVRLEVVYRLPLPVDQLLFTVAYGLAYTVAVLYFSVLIFSGREYR